MSTTVGTIQVIATMNTSQYKKGASDINSANKSIESSGQQAGSRFNNTLTTMSRVGLAAIAAAAVAAGAMIVKNLGNAVSRVDTLNNFPRVMANLGYGANEATSAINKLDKGVRGLPTSLDNIASAMQNIAPSVGSLDEATSITLALNNALLAGGKSADRQAVAMEQFSQAIARGKPDLMEWRSFATTMPGQMKQLSNSLGYDNWQQLAEAVNDGSISFSDVTKKMVELNTKGLGQFPSFAEQAKNASGGLQTGITQMNTAITRGIANVIQAVGSTEIANAITNIGKAFEGVLNGFAGFVKNNRELATSLAAAIAIVGGAFIAASVGVAIFNAVMAVNPIVWVLTGIAALVAGLILLEKRTKVFSSIWGALQQAMQPVVDFFTNNILPILQEIGAFIGGQFKQAWDNISTAFAGLMTALQPLLPILKIIGIALLVGIATPILAVVAGIVVLVAAVTAVVTVFNWLWGVASTVFNAIFAVVSTVFNGIAAVYNATLAPVFSLIGTVIKAVFTVVVAVLTALFRIWSAIFQGIFKVVSTVFNAIWGVISPILNRVWGFIKPILDRIGNTFKTVFNNIKNFVSDAFNNISKFVSKFVNVGKDVVEGLKRGITNGAESVKNAVLDIAKGAEKAIKNFFGIKSPSRLFAQIGTYMMQGLAGGINKGSSLVSSAMGGVNSGILGSIGGSIAAPTISPISPIRASSIDEGSIASSPTRQTHIENLNLANDVDADRFLRKLSGDQEITSAGLVPNQEYM